MVKLFDVVNNAVVPTEHCYTLNFLKDIMDTYPDDYLKIYQYLFYMTCPNPDLNPFFDVPEEDKEEQILHELLPVEFSTEDELIISALEKCNQLYETPTKRAYLGIKISLDNMAKALANTSFTFGRDGSATGLLAIAKNFDAVRQSFKGTYKDLMDEQKSTVRGNKNLAYDDE